MRIGFAVGVIRVATADLEDHRRTWNGCQLSWRGGLYADISKISQFLGGNRVTVGALNEGHESNYPLSRLEHGENGPLPGGWSTCVGPEKDERLTQAPLDKPSYHDAGLPKRLNSTIRKINREYSPVWVLIPDPW